MPRILSFATRVPSHSDDRAAVDDLRNGVVDTSTKAGRAWYQVQTQIACTGADRGWLVR